MNAVIIGMAEMQIVKAPVHIATLGLGSCIGVVLYDKRMKIAGMVHIMLPKATIGSGMNKAKFADTGVVELYLAMIRQGASKPNLVSKIAGGAHMFGAITNKSNDLLKVGERNAAACKETLKRLQIPLIAEDTGGKYGRTIEFSPEDGVLHIKAVGKSEYTI